MSGPGDVTLSGDPVVESGAVVASVEVVTSVDADAPDLGLPLGIPGGEKPGAQGGGVAEPSAGDPLSICSS